jgi:hypothetical protein
MWCLARLVPTDVSGERVVPTFRFERIRELGKMMALLRFSLVITAKAVPSSQNISTLKTEGIRSSET